MEPRRNSWTASHANILPRTYIYSNIKYGYFIKHSIVFIYLHGISTVTDVNWPGGDAKGVGKPRPGDAAGEVRHGVHEQGAGEEVGEVGV
jgi:hypothetical protein